MQLFFNQTQFSCLNKLGYQDAQVPPLEKGARGISSSGYNQIIKTIFFAYLVINTLIFKITKLILLLKLNAEIPLNPPFTKGEVSI